MGVKPKKIISNEYPIPHREDIIRKIVVAKSILDRVLEKTKLKIWLECRLEGLPMPKITLYLKGKDESGALTAILENGEIAFSVNKINELLSQASKPDAIERMLVEALFHGLAQYIRMMRVDSKERETYLKRLKEDPEFNKKEEELIDIRGVWFTLEFYESKEREILEPKSKKSLLTKIQNILSKGKDFLRWGERDEF